MREIKYKAYLKEEKKLCLVSNINFENRTAYLLGATPKTVENTVIQIGSAIIKQTIPTDGRACSFEEIELMQYTGLKDKNGKEIYEGDVVKVTDNSKEKYYPEYIGQIDYSQGGFWCVKHNGYGGTGYYLSDLQHDTQRRNAILEVIGNIYENPELLK